MKVASVTEGQTAQYQHEAPRTRLVHGNVIPMGIPCETSHGMGWDGTGINCYGMGMGQINMSHGQPCQKLTAFLLIKFNHYKVDNYTNRKKMCYGYFIMSKRHRWWRCQIVGRNVLHLWISFLFIKNWSQLTGPFWILRSHKAWYCAIENIQVVKKFDMVYWGDCCIGWKLVS